MTPELILVWYQGPADLGRIDLTVSSKGRVHARYENHPMVKAKTKPWAKDVEMPQGDVAELFRVIQSAEVRKTKLEEPVLMPGQDVVVKSLAAAFGKTPPFFKGTFVDTPKALEPTLAELQKIYLSVRP